MDPYTHPEYVSLMAGVCADPDDDARRLVFADWLQEHGEADRAEFIRLQVALARRSPRAKDPAARAAATAARKADKKRVEVLLARHQKWWEKPLHPAYGFEYARGFAAEAKFAAEGCMASLTDVLAAAPIRDIYVHYGGGEETSYSLVEYLDRERVWDRLTRLSVCLKGLTDEQIVRLAEFPLFWRVAQAEVGISVGSRGRAAEEGAVAELRRLFHGKVRISHWG